MKGRYWTGVAVAGVAVLTFLHPGISDSKDTIRALVVQQPQIFANCEPIPQRYQETQDDRVRDFIQSYIPTPAWESSDDITVTYESILTRAEMGEVLTTLLEERSAYGYQDIDVPAPNEGAAAVYGIETDFFFRSRDVITGRRRNHHIIITNDDEQREEVENHLTPEYAYVIRPGTREEIQTEFEIYLDELENPSRGLE
jgi:hypothetical protein